VLDDSSAQDEIAMTAIYAAANYILRADPNRVVLIDGRTFSRTHQLRDLLALAESVQQPPRIIECVCDDKVVRGRLERDLLRGEHLAGNRTFDRYLRVKALAERPALPRLTLDTGQLSLDQCLAWAFSYVRATQPAV
jgi:hypothetical protein